MLSFVQRWEASSTVGVATWKCHRFAKRVRALRALYESDYGTRVKMGVKTGRDCLPRRGVIPIAAHRHGRLSTDLFRSRGR